MAGRNPVQTVGNSVYTLTHALLNGGAPINIVGLKLEANYFKAKQVVDNSKMVLLVDGNAITLTNNARATRFTMMAVDTGGSIADGNLVACCRALQGLGDSIGGTFRVATLINGLTAAITFLTVTFATGDLLNLAGNDVPDYSMEFNSADWLQG